MRVGRFGQGKDPRERRPHLGRKQIQVQVQIQVQAQVQVQVLGERKGNKKSCDRRFRRERSITDTNISARKKCNFSKEEEEFDEERGRKRERERERVEKDGDVPGTTIFSTVGGNSGAV